MKEKFNSGPVGIAMRALVKEGRIASIELEETKAPFFLLERIGSPEWDIELIKWVERYCAGHHDPFALDLSDLPPFTRACLRHLASIPWGETEWYSEVAVKMNHPRAARAVGGACGRNPFPLLIPCHRVLARGGIGGFSLPLAIKEKLLSFEKNVAFC